MKHTRHALLALAAGAAVALTGCSEKQATFESTPVQSAAAAPSSVVPSAPETPQLDDSPAATAPEASSTPTPAGDSSAQVAALGEPVTTLTKPARVDGDPEATVRAEVYPLVRQGKAVILTVGFTVESSASDRESLAGFLGQGWSPYLVDSQNLKKHLVLKADGVPLMTDDVGTVLATGQTFIATAAFPAPPAEVTAMDVLVTDGAPLAKGVPVK